VLWGIEFSFCVRNDIIINCGQTGDRRERGNLNVFFAGHEIASVRFSPRNDITTQPLRREGGIGCESFLTVSLVTWVVFLRVEMSAWPSNHLNSAKVSNPSPADGWQKNAVRYEG